MEDVYQDMHVVVPSYREGMPISIEALATESSNCIKGARFKR